MNLWWLWTSSNWARLVNGESLFVPTWLSHPKDAGFTLTPWADSVGQRENWVLSLEDRSRLHIHVFDGYAMLHRDRWDPARGPVELVMHGLFESKTVQRLAVLGGIAFVTVNAVRAISDR